VPTAIAIKLFEFAIVTRIWRRANREPPTLARPPPVPFAKLFTQTAPTPPLRPGLTDVSPTMFSAGRKFKVHVEPAAITDSPQTIPETLNMTLVALSSSLTQHSGSSCCIEMESSWTDPRKRQRQNQVHLPPIPRFHRSGRPAPHISDRDNGGSRTWTHRLVSGRTLSTCFPPRTHP